MRLATRPLQDDSVLVVNMRGQEPAEPPVGDLVSDLASGAQSPTVPVPGSMSPIPGGRKFSGMRHSRGSRGSRGRSPNSSQSTHSGSTSLAQIASQQLLAAQGANPLNDMMASIFDGHGGSEVSKFVASRFEDAFLKSDYMKQFVPDFETVENGKLLKGEVIAATLRDIYLKLDKEVR